jgi:hypothetical protein
MLLGFLPEFLRRVAAGKLNLARSYPASGGARDVSQPEPKAVAGRGTA